MTLATALVLGLGAVATPTTALADPETAARGGEAGPAGRPEAHRHRRAGARGGDHRRRPAGRRRVRRRARPRTAQDARRGLRTAAARHRAERLHRQDAVAGRRVPDQRVRRRPRPADDDAGHDRRRTPRPSSLRPRRAQEAALAGRRRRRTRQPRPPRPAWPSCRRRRRRSSSRVAEYEATSPGSPPRSRRASPPPSRARRCARRAVDDLPEAPGAAGTAIALALAQVGRPYVWGASGPDGFDCSGLTSFAYARGRDLAAALEPGPVRHRHAGVAVGPPAR